MIARVGSIFSDVEQAFCLGKGSVGGGEAGGKAKMTPDAGGKSVSEKSQATPGLQGPPFRNQKVSRQNFSSVK